MTINQGTSSFAPSANSKEIAALQRQSEGLLQAPLLEFGEYCLDISNVRLYRAGVPVALTPKVFTVLRHLVESGGRLVSKDELLDNAWAGRVVGDAALQVCIGEIRKALCDDRRNPRYIKTVHKQGYRFIAEVTHPAQSLETRSPSYTEFSPVQLVGRDDAFARLERCLESVLRKKRQVVFITGEPGIGKTTLAKAFLERESNRHGLSTTSGQCIDHQGTPEAYLPILDALGRLCRTPDSDRITTILRQHAPTWLAQMPALLSESERERLQRQLVGCSQERMLREMVEALEAIVVDIPLILLIEDLQWSDHATLDLLAYLARRSEPARLLVLGTYRPMDVILNQHPLKEIREALLGQHQFAEVPLELLTQNDIAAYLKGRFPGIADEHIENLAQMIFQNTNGNPLFVVNIVAHLIERGWFRSEGDLWYVPDDYLEQNISVPESLREMIAHQLQCCSTDQLSILEAASVAGMTFSTDEITVGLNGEVAAVEEVCEQLAQNARFLRQLGLDEWPDGTLTARYEFTHTLYREVLYQRLVPVRRAQIHRSIGTRLEKAYGKKIREQAAQLAAHFDQARRYDKACLHHRYAAETALTRHAHREAVAHLTKSLQSLAKLPDTLSRNEQELQLQIALGSALLAVKGYAAQEVEKAYSRANDLCQQLGESPLAAQTAIGLGTYYLFSGKLHSALRVVEQLYSSVQHQKDQALHMVPQVGLGTAFFYLGEPHRARHHLERGINAYEPERHRQIAFQYGQDFGVVGLSINATVLWILGFPDQARKHSQEALALAERLSHQYSEAVALFWNARVHHLCGENRAACNMGQRAATLSAEKQFALQSVASAWMYSAENQDAHETAESLTKLRKSLEAWQEIGTKLSLPYYQTLLMTAYVRTGQLPQATHALDQALETIEETNERWWEADIHRLKGELLAKSGEPLDAVETCFQKSLEIARNQQAKSLELRAAMSLGWLWQRQGKAHQAREILQSIYGWFTEGFDTHDLKSAASLLQQLDEKS